MDKLHQSQVKIYRATAIHSIKEWALSLSLQPMEERDTKETFVDRCVSAGTNVLVPNWQLPNAKAVAITEIRKRANDAYEKYHPVEEDMKEEVADETEDSTDETSEDDRDEKDDGVGHNVIDSVVTTKIKQQVKYAHPNSHKQKGDNNNTKNVSVRKKAVSIKGGGYRNKGGPGNRGGRRGGRGGGKFRNNNSN